MSEELAVAIPSNPSGDDPLASGAQSGARLGVQPGVQDVEPPESVDGGPSRPSPLRGAHFASAIVEVADTSDKVLSIAMGFGSTIHPILKVYGSLALLGGVATITVTIVTIVSLITRFATGNLGDGTFVIDMSASALFINAVQFVLSIILALAYAVLGVRLLLNKRRGASAIAYTMIMLIIASSMCSVMLDGLGGNLVMPFINLIVLLIISTYVDPTLAKERELQRKQRDIETRDAAQAGTLGRDETGKGYISLNFFNLFWIFMVASIVGLFIETVYRFVTAGVLEDRAGLLFGAFSPIYGVGAVVITLALNRFYKKNPLLIFIVAAIIGAAFEYFVSWFFEAAFGIAAWDYSGSWYNDDGSINPLTFMNINGRTSLMFAVFWGLLGLVWVKLALPKLLELINLIPWNLRYGLTLITATAMFLNCGLTLVSFDCWYERTAGGTPVEPIEWFCAEHFDDEFMSRRFQTITVNPDNAARKA